MSKRIDPLDVSLAIEHGELSVGMDDDGYIYLIDNYNGEEFIIGESQKEKEMNVVDIHVDEYYCPNCGCNNNTSDNHIVGHNYCPNCGQKLYQKGEVK